MPFVVAYAFAATAAQKRALVRDVTGAVCSAYGVEAASVAVYLFEIGDDDYAHAGETGDAAPEKRVFIQVHALGRPAARKRALVEGITRAVSTSLDVSGEIVAVYIHDTPPGNIAHGGVLLADAGDDP